MEKLSEVMGDEFVSLFELIENKDSPKFLNVCLALKIRAKKSKTVTKQEFCEDKDLNNISAAIKPYILAFQREEQQIKEDAERVKVLNKKKAALVQEAKQAKAKSQYLEYFRDFPEFGQNRIKRSSYADKILTRLQKGEASEKDFFWLHEKGFDTPEISQALLDFFMNRAKTHLKHWERAKKPWSLVNAIADFRKSKTPELIIGTIQSNYPFKFSKSNRKLNSALLTTSGGVYRDLYQYSESLKLGEEAHKLSPTDFRPCTLIGASHMLLGNINDGHCWYDKAIDRGFKPESYDNELRSIYMRSNIEIKNELKNSLLARGYNYSWLKN